MLREVNSNKTASAVFGNPLDTVQKSLFAEGLFSRGGGGSQIGKVAKTAQVLQYIHTLIPRLAREREGV